MRRLPGQVLRLGVAHDSLALVRTSRLFGARTTVLAEVPLQDANLARELARGLGALQGALQADGALAGWPLRVVLADELARMWPVAPPPGAATPADLEAAAAMRYQSLFGASPAGWTIAADWASGQPFLAAALSAPLLEVLLNWSREAGCHLVGIVPQLVAAMNGWRKLRRPGAWFGLVHGGVLSVAVYEGARLLALRSAVVPPGAGREWLESLVAREALRVGIERPGCLQVCGSAPRTWAGQDGNFACTLLESAKEMANGGSGTVRLACTGGAA